MIIKEDDYDKSGASYKTVKMRRVRKVIYDKIWNSKILFGSSQLQDAKSAVKRMKATYVKLRKKVESL